MRDTLLNVRQLNHSMSEKFKMRDGDTMLIMASRPEEHDSSRDTIRTEVRLL